MCRYSLVIPTYQRRHTVVEGVRALAHQTSPPQFEVVVVVDGSTDGTAGALRGLELPFPLVVLEQPNQGAASARNHGARVARGEWLLFLDDDMEADPQMLAEHDRSRAQGARVVFGHLPLHPKSPRNFLSASVGVWAERRRQRLGQGSFQLEDLLTGQVSLARDLFWSVDGFDTSFTHEGSWGGEDVDLFHRLRRCGQSLAFNPAAISAQRYLITPRQNLRQWYQAGQAHLRLARKHPELAAQALAVGRSELGGLRPWRTPLTSLVLRMLEGGWENGLSTRLFFRLRDLEFWRGVRAEGGAPLDRVVRVLAYHGIADLGECSVLAPYAVPPRLFAWQLDELLGSGYRFIDPDHFLRFLRGIESVPDKALLLTFDDGYQDLEAAWPLLRERGIRPAIFAVSSQLGGSNLWDQRLGARSLPLMDDRTLARLAREGAEIGCHSRTHARLWKLPADQLPGETARAAQELESAGLGRPRLFAYPYGISSRRVEEAVRGAGFEAAFRLGARPVRPLQMAFRLPRLELGRQDRGWRFRWKVAAAGHRGLQRLAAGLKAVLAAWFS